MVFLCFNVFILTLSTTFFMTQFQNAVTLNSTITLAELKPMTSIYDAALSEMAIDPILNRLIPGLAYVLIVLVSIITMAVAIYTASRFFTRHPNYIISLCGAAASISALLAPNYVVARVLDTSLVAVLVICALIFDILSICWIYGAKNIYTDLEFSIGRPILKSWVFMWCVSPVLLTALLAWWSSSTTTWIDVGIDGVTIPRWAPIVVAIFIIFICAVVEVYQQVDYNCCSMIQEAAQSSTDWGPADPIVRHAWKQWRSVCEDTGQKDFTLRRRGTRDYTHSIKKGQYSRGGKYGQHIRKASTGGSSSPNYSGSIFDDSAIEEDVSVRNFQGHPSKAAAAQSSGKPPYRYSIESRKLSQTSSTVDKPMSTTGDQRQYFYVPSAATTTTLPVLLDTSTNSNAATDYHNVSKVEILSSPVVGTSVITLSPKRNSYAKNPMARVVESSMAPTTISHTHSLEINCGGGGGGGDGGGTSAVNIKRESGGGVVTATGGVSRNLNGTDHICWRNFSVNSDEFSTEL